MSPFIQFIFARLREPSSLAAISALGLLFGLPPGTVDLAAQVVGGIAGLAAIAVAERGSKPAAPPQPPVRAAGDQDAP